jgi:predicted PurR-regulated permease PerM
LEKKEFTRRVWTVCAIAALIITGLLLIKATFNALLLVLAAALIAIYFRGLAALIQRKLKSNQTVSVLVSVIGTTVLLALLLWLVGAKVQSQLEQLTETFPKMLQNAKEKVSSTALGSYVIEKMSSKDAQSRLQSFAKTFFKSTFGVVGDVYVVLILAMFFTASPLSYIRGIIQLIPPRSQELANKMMQKLGSNLRKWLKGKLFAMLVVFVLTAIGLFIIGVPMWLALAVIAGVLNFIPNFGPLLAMIPAVLVAFMNGPATAAYVAGLYIVVQVVESNLITPMVQKKLVNIPPAMIIIAQLLIAPLSGGWGLIVATPLLLIIMSLVDELYIRRRATQ